MQHQVGIQHGGDVGKTARAVKGIQPRQVGVAAAKHKHQTVALDGIRHRADRSFQGLFFLFLDPLQIFYNFV